MPRVKYPRGLDRESESRTQELSQKLPNNCDKEPSQGERERGIFIEAFREENLNTSWPTPLEAYSCQALQAEPQRIEYVPASTLAESIRAKLAAMKSEEEKMLARLHIQSQKMAELERERDTLRERASAVLWWWDATDEERSKAYGAHSYETHDYELLRAALSDQGGGNGRD